jgi:predicted amidohydrolase YtcJ
MKTLTRFATLILAVGMLIGCIKQPQSKLMVNVNGYTLKEDSLHQFSALAFKGGKVVATGSTETLQADYPNAEVMDGKGKTLIPGLFDAHGHVMGLGYANLDVNLVGTQSLNETLEVIESYADDHADMQWIRGRGWNQTHWPSNAFPTAKDLDKAVPDRPAFLSRVDGHAAWANTMAMEKAGITKETQSPPGGKIIRDADGNPTGVFVDAATELISTVIPERTSQENDQALDLALKRMRSVGLTTVHDAGIDPGTYKRYKRFADEGKLTTRIYAMARGTEAGFDIINNAGQLHGYGNDCLWVESVKLYADGALGSRGAAMLEPYSDDPDNRGLLFIKPDALSEKIEKASTAGYQVNIHAIGDRANRVVLDAFEKAYQINEDWKAHRNRIEHAQIVALSDIPRFKTLNLIASMQPTHATSDMNMAGDRIGKERLKGAYAWQRYLDQGTKIAAGSDFPVESANPFFGWYSAVARMDHEGNPEGGWYADQGLSRVEAFRAFTLDAAYAGHQEDILGSLESGKYADFLVLDSDPFTCPIEQLWQIEVLQTWVSGQQVYQKKSAL